MSWMITYVRTEYGDADGGPHTTVSNKHPVDFCISQRGEYGNSRVSVLFAIEIDAGQAQAWSEAEKD